jgi:hypothetical protein
MRRDAIGRLLRQFARPCFSIYGRANYEPDWHLIDVFATHRRDITSRWPLWRGTSITWSAAALAVGSDFAAAVLREQTASPASRNRPVNVAGGRLRIARGDHGPATAGEIIAHECGHTGQARRLGVWYLPVVGTLTLFREGPRWWNRFENEASATGQFGGIVDGSVDERFLMFVATGCPSPPAGPT